MPTKNPIKELSRKLKTNVLTLEMLYAFMSDKTLDAKKSYLKRACQKGDLLRLRSGLYLFGEEYRSRPSHPFEIANHIREPSYVSLESALSYYGLIPEAVYTTTSVTTQLRLEQKTPVGQFSYSHLKSNYFNFGFYRAQEKMNHQEVKFLIATPLKALMDYIVLRKKNYRRIEEVEEDLRFNLLEFKSYTKFINQNKIEELLKIYKSHRLQVFLKELKKL